jgi:hypothetical protein
MASSFPLVHSSSPERPLKIANGVAHLCAAVARAAFALPCCSDLNSSQVDVQSSPIPTDPAQDALTNPLERGVIRPACGTLSNDATSIGGEQLKVSQLGQHECARDDYPDLHVGFLFVGIAAHKAIDLPNDFFTDPRVADAPARDGDGVDDRGGGEPAAAPVEPHTHDQEAA